MRRRFVRALAIYIAAHLYIAWRLALPLPSPWWQVGVAVVVLLAPSFPIAVPRARRLGREAARPWLLLGYMWLGFAMYFLLAALASDVAVGFGADRRVAAIVGIAATVGVVVAGLVKVARGPLVRRVRVPMPRLGVASFRLVHLTDVHIGAIIGREFTERLVRRVNGLEPDLIVITGDLIDGPLSELQRHIEPLRELRARHGVYAVTGNHEFYWTPGAWLDHLRSLGLRVLRNEHVTIAGAFELAGVDDWSYGEDVPRAVDGRDPELPLVLLAHHPRTIQNAVAAGVDLQLSGHTHGGQLLPWGLLARIWDPKLSGLGRFGSTWLYVGQGTGFWGPPLRVGTSCEIASIELVPA